MVNLKSSILFVIMIEISSKINEPYIFLSSQYKLIIIEGEEIIFKNSRNITIMMEHIKSFNNQNSHTLKIHLRFNRIKKKSLKELSLIINSILNLLKNNKISVFWHWSNNETKILGKEFMEIVSAKVVLKKWNTRIKNY